MSGGHRRPEVPGGPTNPVGRAVTGAFATFVQQEASGSVVMLVAAAVALLLANSPWYAAVDAFWHVPVGLTIGPYEFSESLFHWVNDGLMAVFFLVIGLEIKREVLVGELSERRKAVLPVLAALGGMVAPALIFVALAAGTPGAAGWGVPMATDIAFALGVMALVGPGIPPALRVFLAALAIADDIGAILVIAAVYSAGISWWWLGGVAVCLLVLVAFNRLGVDSPWPYFAVGGLLWFAMLNSGVHATLAGVLVAMTIPATARLTPLEFTGFARGQLDEIEQSHDPEAHVLEDDHEQQCALAVGTAARLAAAPLQRLEFALNPFATYVVLPLFALANAGVRLVGIQLGASPGAWQVIAGIALGLALGKPIGIAGMTWIATKLGIADLPADTTWPQVLGAGLLGGIGFTVSLFVATLAFEDPGLLGAAKLAILVTSLAVGGVGFLALRRVAGADSAQARDA